MKSKELEWRLKRSKEREKHLKELDAPQAIIDGDKKLQRKLYRKKVIEYARFAAKLLERMKCNE